METKKKNRLVRRLSGCLLSVVFFVLAAFPAAAASYGDIPSDRIKYVVKASGWLNILRLFLWKILTGCAELIDCINQSINKLLEVNLYDLYIKNIPTLTSGVGKIALAIAGLSIVFAAIYLVAFHDKIRQMDFIRSIIIIFILLVALPFLTACVSDIRGKGTDLVTDISIENNSEPTKEVPKTIGQTLLGSCTYMIINDGSPRVAQLSELESWPVINPYTIDINQLNLNLDWTSYPSGTPFTESTGGTKRYSELTMENMLQLLGCSEYYTMYLSIVGTENTASVFRGTVDQNGVKLYEHYDAEKLSELVIQQINEKCGTSLSVSTSISDALSDPDVEKKLVDLNYRNNQQIINTGESVLSDGSGNSVTWFSLRNEEDEKNASTVNLILGAISNLGTYQEYVYTYDCDFFMAFVVVIATLVSMLYAGFRLASLLYDVMFVQIVAPLFVASDMNNTGRAKKAVNNLVSTSIVFIVVVLLIKIYLICVNGIVGSSLNTVVKLFLVMGGVKFLTDGPDIVTRLLGVDAGVRNGAASVVALTSAARTALHSAKTVASVPGKAAGAAKAAASGVDSAAKAADKAAHTVGKAAHAAADTAKSAVHRTREASWERQGEEKARTDHKVSPQEYSSIRKDYRQQQRSGEKEQRREERKRPRQEATEAGRRRFEEIYNSVRKDAGHDDWEQSAAEAPASHAAAPDASAPDASAAQAPSAAAAAKTEEQSAAEAPSGKSEDGKDGES